MTSKTVTELDLETVSRTQHLIRRGNVWYYNRAWPLDLQSTLGKAPFRRSLRTESKAEACRAKADAEREYWRRVDAATAKPQERQDAEPSEREAEALALQWFRGELVDFETALDFEQRNPAAHSEAVEVATEALANECRELATERGGAKAREIAARLASASGYAASGFALVRLVQRARISLSELWLARLSGDYGTLPKDRLFASALEAPQRPSGSHFDQPQGVTLRDLFAAHREAVWGDIKDAGRKAYSAAYRKLAVGKGGGRTMKPDKLTVFGVFSKDKRLVISLFQRFYVGKE